jgi:hypothetical protein
MENLRVEDFLPYYLQYDEESTIYPPPENTLYNNINAKREFNINKLPINEGTTDISKSTKGKARKHQEFMAKFMSPITPYNKMLVFHEVGTGKCVLPGTQIYVNHNRVNIESLWNHEPTTLTESYEEWLDVKDSNLLTKTYKDGKIVEGRILRAYRQFVDEDICIYSTSDARIECTQAHKFLSNNEWIDFNYIIPSVPVKITKLFGTFIMLQDQPITNLEMRRYKGLVYDIEVETTHNYIANNFITHNTCLLSNVVELARSQNVNMPKPLILVRGQTIRKNIIKEIANKCFPDKYTVGKIDIKSKKQLTQETIDRRTTKNVNRNYQIETFYTFAKKIKSLSVASIENLYSNRYIFVDEAHRLREQTSPEEEEKGEKVEVYREIFKFFHSVKNCKMLLMTATPMKDKPTEICPLLNLLLPLTNQMIQENLFDGSGNIKNPVQLIYYFKGIVSFVRQEGGKLKVEYEGTVAPTMRQIKTVRLPMLDIQNTQYKIDYDTERVDKENIENIQDIEQENEEDEKVEKSTLYKKSKNDSLFVFPPDLKSRLVSSGYNYYLPAELVKYFTTDSLEEKLALLKRHSVKYEYVINHMINDRQKTFIFSNIVSNSGATLLGALLNVFGYSPLEITGDVDVNTYMNSLQRGRRYVVLTGKISDSIISKLVDIFNHPKNIYGEYLQAIIGSSKISEGLSFKEVRQCYILTPFWNNTETEQAIGRVVRLDSHDRLAPEERQVDIYRVAAIPQYGNELSDINNSIDMIMYRRSEDKDVQIKAVERLLKQAAVDCTLNRERNIRPTDKNDSRECDYTDCDYKCEFITTDKVKNIYDTYNIYYAEEIINEIQKIVIDLFSKKSSYDFEEMFTYFAELRIQPVLLLRALKEIIYQNVPIVNRMGFVNFLKEDRNLYFLVDDPRVPSIFTYYYYSDRPTPQPKIEFNEYLKTLNYSTLEDRLLYLKDNFDDLNESDILGIVSSFDKNIMDTLLRQFIISQEESSFKSWFISNFGEYVVKINRYKVDFYLYNLSKNPDDLYYYNLDESDVGWNSWKRSNEEIVKLFNDYKDNVLQYLTTDNPYGYYAKIDEKGRFLITKIIKLEDLPRTKKGEISKKAIPKGLECGTGQWSKPKMLFLFMLFGAIADKSGNPKPYPALTRQQKNIYRSNISDETTASDIKKLIESEREALSKTFMNDDYLTMVKEHNKANPHTKIVYKLDRVDDLEELKRIYMLLKFNEIKGDDSNLCVGLKRWFIEVGLFTRFV